jgi:hypothetical protein
MTSLLLLAALVSSPARAASPDPVMDAAKLIATEVQGSSEAYKNLAALTALGPRLGGTPAAEKAVDWAMKTLDGYGFDRVWTQPVSVPHWERGAESAAALTAAGEKALAITALGGSPGTSSGPVTAEVVEVKSLDEVRQRGKELAGKIVFYNRPMDGTLTDAFEAYGKAVDQRSRGPAAAGAAGAVAVLVRSMTTLTDDPLPHTGGTWFADTEAKIPAAALATRDANALSAMLAKEPKLRVRLSLGARILPPAPSHNVLAEIRGREKPEEVVVVGGHLDSWDLGPGAHDDGAGVAESIQALRALAKLKLRPRRTVRLVLFMSEEVGGVGGRAYAEDALARGERHAAALESDRGGFSPLGFTASTATMKTVRAWKPYLALAGADQVFPGGGGTDTSALEEAGVPAFELVPVSTRYFDYHHSARDTLAAVDHGELARGGAAVALFTYLAAEQGVTAPPAGRPVAR